MDKEGSRKIDPAPLKPVKPEATPGSRVEAQGPGVTRSIRGSARFRRTAGLPGVDPKPTPAGIDEPTLDKARTGDQEAFARIYRAYLNPMFGYIYRRVGNRQTAEDLAQEIFLRLRDHITDVRSLAPYLYSMANNLIADYRRRLDTRKTTPLDTAFKDPAQIEDQSSVAIDTDILKDERYSEVAKAALFLSDRYRFVLVASTVQEKDYASIARALSEKEGRPVSEQAIKNIADRIKDRFREIMPLTIGGGPLNTYSRMRAGLPGGDLEFYRAYAAPLTDIVFRGGTTDILTPDRFSSAFRQLDMKEQVALTLTDLCEVAPVTAASHMQLLGLMNNMSVKPEAHEKELTRLVRSARRKYAEHYSSPEAYALGLVRAGEAGDNLAREEIFETYARSVMEGVYYRRVENPLSVRLEPDRFLATWSELSEVEKTVMLLHVTQNRSYPQIAQAINNLSLVGYTFNVDEVRNVVERARRRILRSYPPETIAREVPLDAIGKAREGSHEAMAEVYRAYAQAILSRLMEDRTDPTRRRLSLDRRNFEGAVSSLAVSDWYVLVLMDGKNYDYKQAAGALLSAGLTDHLFKSAEIQSLLRGARRRFYRAYVSIERPHLPVQTLREAVSTGEPNFYSQILETYSQPIIKGLAVIPSGEQAVLVDREKFAQAWDGIGEVGRVVLGLAYGSGLDHKTIAQALQEQSLTGRLLNENEMCGLVRSARTDFQKAYFGEAQRKREEAKDHLLPIEVIRNAQSGDPASFDQVFRTYGIPVIQAIFNPKRESSDIEINQERFTRAWDGLTPQEQVILLFRSGERQSYVNVAQFLHQSGLTDRVIGEAAMLKRYRQVAGKFKRLYQGDQ